jgi:hypothetical protein
MIKINTLTKMIISGLFLIVIIGIFVWLALETKNERSDLLTNIYKLQQAQAKDSYSGSLRTLARDTISARKKLDSITKDRDVVTLIELLEESSESLGIKISIDAVSSGSDEGVFKSVIVALSSTATFRQLVHLISLLESLPAVSSVDQFELKMEDNSNGIWRMQVRVRFLLETSV